MKNNSFEESKRVSTTKGFLGYRNTSKGLIYQIRENKTTFSKRKINSFLKMITCDYPHEYPLSKVKITPSITIIK